MEAHGKSRTCLHPTALMKGLNSLRNAKKLFDVSLIVEGRIFPAHRVVLAACSDYFCAMFTEPMREARQFEICLEGVSARGIELLLEYIYTSKLELDRSNIQDALSVSTHVQMQDVVDACSMYLESQIDLENCVSIASLAELYSLHELKKRSYRYLCSRLSELAKSTDLLNLTWDQMEFILACNNPVDCAEEHVLEITLQYCLDSKLKPEIARRLLANIRFDEISTIALHEIANRINNNESEIIDNEDQHIDAIKRNEENTLLANALSKLVSTEKLRLEQNLSNNGLSTCNLTTVKTKNLRDVLINSRGMELTLVKIGGFIPNGLTNEISCYLPLERKWERLTVIPHIEQCNYGTAVLRNDLYVVGGSYDISLKEYTHPFGFCYCPSKNEWKTIAPIQSDRCLFSLNAIGDNYLYAVGGICELNDFGSEILSNCERYNVLTDKWEYIPALVENRSQHAGVVLGDKLYISGGINCDEVLSTLWCFDTETEVWTKLSSMLTPRADHVLIAFDGSIYACGGWYENESTQLRVLAETIDVYDIERNQWTPIAENPLPKYYTGVAAVGHEVFFVGGLLSTPTINRSTSSVHCFNLKTKTWSTKIEWECPQEVWECQCTSFFVPIGGHDIQFYGGNTNDGDCDENNL